MAVARSLGLRVPEDLSVIGFDNVPESALGDPPLTTVEQPIQQMGSEAVRLLLELIDDPDAAPGARRSCRRGSSSRQSCSQLAETRMTTAERESATYLDPTQVGRRAGRRPARPHDARREARPARQRLELRAGGDGDVLARARRAARPARPRPRDAHRRRDELRAAATQRASRTPSSAISSRRRGSASRRSCTRRSARA